MYASGLNGCVRTNTLSCEHEKHAKFRYFLPLRFSLFLPLPPLYTYPSMYTRGYTYVRLPLGIEIRYVSNFFSRLTYSMGLRHSRMTVIRD